jgi:hypothetical protein
LAGGPTNNLTISNGNLAIGSAGTLTLTSATQSGILAAPAGAPAPVPEPGTFALAALGLLLIGGRRVRG